jgi:tetratricopeptide (TPR) repeat protein
MAGLPLGIELAAARTRTYRPQPLLSLLRTRPFVVDGTPDPNNPKGTLHGTIEWSYDLLTPEAQVLLTWLSVFPSGFGFDVPAAGDNHPSDLDSLQELWGAVVDAQPQQGVNASREPHETLDELVRNSLVRRVDGTGDEGDRYSLLDPIRSFALERLGPMRDKAKRFQAQYCLKVAHQADAKIGKDDTAVGVRRLGAERPNMAAALEWFRDTGGRDSELKLCIELSDFWILEGDWAEGGSALAGVLGDETIGEPLQRAIAFNRAGGLARNRADFETARESYITALEIGQSYEAAHSEEADGGDLHALQDALWNQGYALNGLGRIEMALGNSRQARDWFMRALAVRRRMGRKPAIAITLTNLGDLDLAERRLKRAAARFERAHRLRHAKHPGLSDAPGLAISHLKIGVLCMQCGKLDDATVWMRDALKRFDALGYRDWTARTLESLAQLAACKKDHEAASVLWQAAAALDETLGTRKSAYELGRDRALREELERETPTNLSSTAAANAALSPTMAYTYAMLRPAVSRLITLPCQDQH